MELPTMRFELMINFFISANRAFRERVFCTKDAASMKLQRNNFYHIAMLIIALLVIAIRAIIFNFDNWNVTNKYI